METLICGKERAHRVGEGFGLLQVTSVGQRRYLAVGNQPLEVGGAGRRIDTVIVAPQD